KNYDPSEDIARITVQVKADKLRLEWAMIDIDHDLEREKVYRLGKRINIEGLSYPFSWIFTMRDEEDRKRITDKIRGVADGFYYKGRFYIYLFGIANIYEPS